MKRRVALDLLLFATLAAGGLWLYLDRPRSAPRPAREAPLVERREPTRPVAPAPAPRPRTKPVAPQPRPKPTAQAVEPPVSQPRPATPVAPRPDPDRLLDFWFSRYRGTQKVGWGHLVGTRLPNGYRVREEYRTKSGSALTGKVYESRMLFIAEMDRDFVVRRIQLTSNEAGRTAKVLVTRQGQEYLFRTLLEGRETSKRLAVGAPVIGSNDLLFQRLFREGKLRKGFTLKFREFEIGVPRVDERTLRVLEAGSDGAKIAFGAYTARLDRRGVVVELVAGSFRMLAEPESRARELPAQAAMFQDKLQINVGLPNHRLLDQVTMRFDVRGYKGPPIFTDSEYQKVQADPKAPGRYVLRLLPRRFRQRAFPRLGFAVPREMRPFLEADAIRNSDAPEIERKARQIVGAERDSLAAVRKLARWIHVKLEKEYTAVGDQTALATLASMKGDCSEHALLFDSFARSLGIPVKQCSGYVFLGSFGGPHAWSQVWLGQEWIHVDCVLDSVGADPRYILFWKQNATGDYDRTTWIRRGALSSHPVTSRITAFALGRKQIELRQAHGLARRSGRRFVHPLIGIAIDLPAGWQVAGWSDMTRFALTGPGGLQVTVRTWDSHPELIARSNRWGKKSNTAFRIGGKPTWKVDGWMPLYLVEHGSGALLLQLHRAPRGAAAQQALAALFAGIKLER